ncbi:MAG: recombinase family protein, partial [Planctomycetota bacterium]
MPKERKQDEPRPRRLLVYLGVREGGKKIHHAYLAVGDDWQERDFPPDPLPQLAADLHLYGKRFGFSRPGTVLSIECDPENEGTVYTDTAEAVVGRGSCELRFRTHGLRASVGCAGAPTSRRNPGMNALTSTRRHASVGCRHTGTEGGGQMGETAQGTGCLQSGARVGSGEKPGEGSGGGGAAAGPRVAGYVRVSQERNVHRFGLDAQTVDIERYVEYRGWPPARIYREEGVSGYRRDRPMLERLLADARAGRLDVVVFPSIDRA